MSRSVGFERSRARVVRVCDSAGDADSVTLRERVLDQIRRIVAFDWHVWLLTDPETTVGAAPLAEIPPGLLSSLPRLVRLKYMTEVNRWTTLMSPAASLSEATGGQLSRSLVWNELLADHGVGDVASVVFADRFGCWGFLDLWRMGTEAPFTPDDVTFLASITGHVTAAVRRCQAATFASARPNDPDPPGPLLLLLSPDLDVLGQTPQTHEYLRTLVPPPDGQAPIPAGAYNVAAQLLAVETHVDPHPPSTRVHLSAGVWLTLRAARVGRVHAPGRHDIAVTIERATPDERASVFGRAHGLSTRERELLQHLMAGGDTSQVARDMHLSEHTVQDHLKSIFAKTSVHSRRTLLTRVLGT